MAHIISLDKAHAREMGTTEEIEKKLRRRIATQREMGRAIARVKKNLNQLPNFTILHLKGQ